MNYSDIVDICDLSVIYLTYDEPQKNEFWMKIKNMCPWAKRIDGVKGIDNAHKVAGLVSDTERFIVIDGDNLPYENFFEQQLNFTNKDYIYKKAQFRWRSINHINGLRYGNGGISSWTKEYVTNMKTHEAHTDGDLSRIVDFSLNDDDLYWPMHDCYSITYPNYTPFQAWRAGFREGVKMCLDKGTVPTVESFKQSATNRNLNNLTIWHNVGADVENGKYAIYGARYGTYLTMLTDWDHTQMQSFDIYNELYQDFQLTKYNDQFLLKMDEELKTRLGLPIFELNAEQSKFFKRHAKHIKNIDPLERCKFD